MTNILKKKLIKYKQTLNAILLVILLFTLGYILNTARIQNENHFKIDKNIEEIMLLNKDFNLYSDTFFRFHNTNGIQVKIRLSKKELQLLTAVFKLSSIKDVKLKNSYNRLHDNLIKKYDLINQVNLMRNKINEYYLSKKNLIEGNQQKTLTKMYNFAVLDKTTMTEIKKELHKLGNIKNIESKTILTYGLKLKRINEELENIYTKNELNEFNTLYSNYTYSVIHTAYLLIILLFILLVISILFYLYYDYTLSLSQKELNRFRKTVEDSNNIVVITDINRNIKYVNASFTKITGYKDYEVIGKSPQFLKSGHHSQEFYKELCETIYAGKKWSGQFINKNKNGHLSYESATISPVFDENHKVIEFIAIKSDITNETIGQEELLKKEKLLLQQSKMASMGEMLHNIAHQWRQPLSVISTAATGLSVKKELDINVSKEEDIKTLNTINDTTQHLSETINAFRDFFNPNKEKINFKLLDVYKKTLQIIETGFISDKITIIENIENISITNLDNELIQVLLNIFNNARDILVSNKIENKLIFINIYKKNNEIAISIKDNGGGIPDKIIDKVFEPYFTTKHQIEGTGIGLYMSQEIITKHMNGVFSVSNNSFIYENKTYKGAEFRITFPTT